MKKTIIALVTAVLAVVLIRSLAFTSCVIPHNGEETTLYSGDRFIVNRWSYGLRLPLMKLWGYHRILEAKVEKGDIVIFNNPAGKEECIESRSIYVGQCVGKPGDTLMLNEEKLQSNAPGTHPFVIPAKGKSIKVTNWNVRLLCNTINRHEHRKAAFHDNTLYVEGKQVDKVTFTKDYYWVLDTNIVNLTDSRLFGFVPQDHIIGRAALIWFSKDPSKPLWSGYRWNRMFTAVK